MASYDFYTGIDRTQTASVKWGLTKDIFGSDDLLPMWVADMDFQPPVEVKQAMEERLNHGIYGYTFAPPSVGKSIQAWLENLHTWTVNLSWILYSPGVVPSISTAIQAYTNPGDKIILQSPIYTPFFEMIEKNDRIVLNNQLINKENRFEIDFISFEQQLKDGAKLFLLCNPHNPGGRVWTEDELRKLGNLCLKYNCLILSDEIHSDLVYRSYKHVPLCSIDEKFKDIVITCIAPSKTFNLAGLQASAVIIPSDELRDQFKAQQGKQGFFTLNTFGIIGMEAAYRFGHQWLDELLSYLDENVNIATTYITENIPALSVMKPEGTYLLWIDCRSLSLTDDKIKESLIQKGKLALEPGNKYGPGGEGYVRMNIACSRENLMDGLLRLRRAFT
ncbi:MalY/PatB family protein [Cytobacillus sp. FJAT-54145]|uniref:cysteine-S-conjugate beta-lyase n=1 Tax=Cytobacillus spartinae TaxID=3299023 RepID=A0ABW6KF94_9BACI